MIFQMLNLICSIRTPKNYILPVGPQWISRWRITHWPERKPFGTQLINLIYKIDLFNNYIIICWLKCRFKRRKDNGNMHKVDGGPCLLCFSGEIPRLSLNQHSLYVGAVDKPTPPPLTGGQYGKMEHKYLEGGYCQSVLRSQGVFNVPLYF